MAASLRRRSSLHYRALDTPATGYYYEKTEIAYAMEDVERYVVALAEGRKMPKPKPLKRGRKG